MLQGPAVSVESLAWQKSPNRRARDGVHEYVNARGHSYSYGCAYDCESSKTSPPHCPPHQPQHYGGTRPSEVEGVEASRVG